MWHPILTSPLPSGKHRLGIDKANHLALCKDNEFSLGESMVERWDFKPASHERRNEGAAPLIIEDGGVVEIEK